MDKPHAVESVFVPGYPLFKTQALTSQQIFVASLPVICEPDIVVKTEEEDSLTSDGCKAQDTADAGNDDHFRYSSEDSDTDEENSDSNEEEYKSSESETPDDNKKQKRKRLKATESLSEESKFTCKICSADFQRHSNYTIHMKRKHNVFGESINSKTSEDDSKKEAKKDSEPKQDVIDKPKRKRSKSSEKLVLEPKVSCKICSMGFQRHSNYITHMKKKHKEELRKNPEYGIDPDEIPKKKRLKASEKRALIPKIACKICLMGFQRHSNYTSHMKKIHKIVGESLPYSCPNCPRKYEFEYELKRHMLKYIPIDDRRVFPCPQCDRKFQSQVHVARHIRFVHEDIRPFVCEECGEAVHTKTILNEHMLTHSNLRPFECKICGTSFKKKNRLKRHMEIHGEKHICTICGKELSSRATLNKHLLVHTEEKAHKCEYCGRAFKLIKTLKVHLNIHTGEKRYECEFCDRIFTAPSTRRQHKKKVHPEKLLELEAPASASKRICSENDDKTNITQNTSNSLTPKSNDAMNAEAIDFSSNVNLPTTSSNMFYKNSTTTSTRDYSLPDFKVLDFVGRMMME
ncbi:zinc finger protein 345 [Ceratitis capitata]|uniref:(Mediterranean fruit fly) hypothetical protein n=1 Tax=Ceratitis capitata TaxID=7213 RepID=W8C2K1_CERCA|nr:zinc finger protein 345 [Ceratitis capitata]CAD6999161.1 unnamed protein product [Ceratitis capitata]